MIVYCSSLSFLQFGISYFNRCVSIQSSNLVNTLSWVFTMDCILAAHYTNTPSLSIAGNSNSSLHDLFVLIRKKERLLVLLSSSVEGCLTQYEEHLTFPITTCQ